MGIVSGAVPAEWREALIAATELENGWAAVLAVLLRC